MKQTVRSILLGILLTLIALPVSWGSESETWQKTTQLCMVETDSWSSLNGWMQRFERTSVADPWQLIGQPIRVTIGRNGMAWGRGLQTTPSPTANLKVEGDGKSPAGLFRISSAFGMDSSTEYSWLKMPYQQLTSAVECIDDASSIYYNQIVDSSVVSPIDWTHSDKMGEETLAYRLGLFVQQNVDPTEANGGSCIFIRIREEENVSGTGGSIVMQENDLQEIFQWIDIDQTPLLLAMPLDELVSYADQWNLPVDWISQIEEPSVNNAGLFLR